jgi:hypothetical protein
MQKFADRARSMIGRGAAETVESLEPGIVSSVREVVEAGTTGAAAETHHLLPRESTLKSYFESAGLNIDDYTVSIDKATHRLRPDGVHTGSSSWNKQWKEFMAANPKASQQEILQQLESMKADFGIMEK